MNAPAFKTRSEQKLEWLEGLGRPLTDSETGELQKALHAVYVRRGRLETAERIEREWGGGVLKEYEQADAEKLRRATKEMDA